MTATDAVETAETSMTRAIGVGIGATADVFACVGGPLALSSSRFPTHPSVRLFRGGRLRYVA
jgi:hypothetical protein